LKAGLLVQKLNEATHMNQCLM